MASLCLTVAGRPVPMERARRGRNGHWYTPAASVEYRERIQAAWMQNRVSFHDAAIAVCLQVHLPRPPTHLKRDGTVRERFLHKLPPGDCDNYAKAVADALNALAYDDDRQIVCWAAIGKHWTSPGAERTEIQLWPTDLPANGLASLSRGESGDLPS